MAAVAVVRVRGHSRIRRDAVETMEMLRLHKPNHCVVLPGDVTTRRMLQVVKDYVTWGEVGHETIARLLVKRGQITGGDALDDDYVKENSEYTSILSFAKALEKGDARMADVKGLKPVIRLPPPRRGYEKVKKPFSVGGAVGNRGADISKLIGRMLEEPEEVS